MKKHLISIFLIILLISQFVNVSAGEINLIKVAENLSQWTGVAVSQENRIFTNFPRWSQEVPLSVVVLDPDGNPQFFPNKKWNTVSLQTEPDKLFICVQSVIVDDQNFLWALDAANPMFKGVIRNGPKLVKIDLRTNSVAKVYSITDPSTTPFSYLNDVRIDTKNQIAYITDSGAGGLIILDLQTGKSRVVLRNHPSTRSEHITVVIGNIPWVGPDSTSPDIHADGIAYDKANDYLYYKAMTGRTLYRIKGNYLRNFDLTDAQLADHVENMGEVGVCDGLLFANGKIYISDIEHNAIKTFTPGEGTKTIIQSEQLKWPDSFALGPNGYIYVSISRINLLPDPKDPYKIFRFKE